ncbi:MAG: DUF4331 family protein [Gemmatimonadota bacterium]
MTRAATLRRAAWLSIAVAGSVGAFFVSRASLASDHQDTELTELRQTPDINDVYAFPGSTPDRIVLAVTTASPVTPSQSATIGFNPNLLYQIKVDNTGDGIEDLVFQMVAEGTGPNQIVALFGPAAPNQVGTINTRLSGKRIIGRANTTLGSSTGIQFRAGLVDDPFFIDLEQFFRILPDRRPEKGPLSVFPVPATSFRNPGIDFLRGFNALGIVIELPENMLLPPNAGPDPKIGIWATTSS